VRSSAGKGKQFFARGVGGKHVAAKPHTVPVCNSGCGDSKDSREEKRYFGTTAYLLQRGTVGMRNCGVCDVFEGAWKLSWEMVRAHVNLSRQNPD
jgi:hypothetical protein